MARLLDALSHVIQPTYYRKIQYNIKTEKVLTYFVRKSQTSNNLEERTSKPDTIMGSVHLRETQQCAVILPDSCRYLFYPVASHRKVCVLVSSLPGIAGEAYKSSIVGLKIRMS